MISQFSPGTTHVPCHWCGEQVGVKDNDDTYNENPFEPGHRLCQNSEIVPYAETLCYDAPLNYYKLQAIWGAVRGGIKFTDDQRNRIKRSIIDTVEWDFDHDHLASLGHQYDSPTRAKAYACKLVTLMSGGMGLHTRGNLGRKKVFSGNVKKH